MGIEGETKKVLGVQGISEEQVQQIISESMYLSVRTVKTHIYSLLSKLNLQDRAQAAAWANEHRVS